MISGDVRFRSIVRITLSHQDVKNALLLETEVTGEDLPQPGFTEGDKVVVEGWETYDSTIIQVMSYSEGSNIWKYRVRIEKHEPGHEESMETVKLENEISPA